MCIALANQPGSLLGVLPLPGSRPLCRAASPDVESPDLLGNPLQRRPGTARRPVALGRQVVTSLVGLRRSVRVRERGCFGSTRRIQRSCRSVSRGDRP